MPDRLSSVWQHLAVPCDGYTNKLLTALLSTWKQRDKAEGFMLHTCLSFGDAKFMAFNEQFRPT